MKQEIYNKIINIISNELNLLEDDFDENSDLRLDLGMDSIDEMGLIISFEREFGISISDEEWIESDINSVGDLIKYLNKLIN